MNRRKKQSMPIGHLALIWASAFLVLGAGAASVYAAAAVVTVPNFITGDTIGTLKTNYLNQWTFVPVSAITSNVDSRVPSGQHPEVGSEITAGQAIHLFVKGLGEEGECTTEKIIIVVESIFILVLLGYIILRRPKPTTTG